MQHMLATGVLAAAAAGESQQAAIQSERSCMLNLCCLGDYFMHDSLYIFIEG